MILVHILLVLKWTSNESGLIFGSIAIGPKDKALSAESGMQGDIAAPHQWLRSLDVNFSDSPGLWL